MRHRPTLIVFLKEPVAGRAKTRLGADIGDARAAQLYRAMAGNVLRAVDAGRREGRWRACAAIDGMRYGPFANALQAKGWDVVRQGRGDLGDRMGRAFFRAPDTPTAIIGADAPEMSKSHLVGAFSALQGADAVFGPAADGGYWLIGLSKRRAAPNLFNGVRWSSQHALADTKASLPEGFRTSLVDQLSDVDRLADLQNLDAGAMLRHRSVR